MPASHEADFYQLGPCLASVRNAPTAIDLFAGAGGITLGLLNAGFSVLASSDISAACARTHQRNLPHVPFVIEDIGRLTGPALLDGAGIARGQLDLLVGGPPCQGFSIIGQRLLDDPRNKLVKEFIRIVGEVRPRVAVIENVPGLATLGGGVLLEAVGNAFGDLGYDVSCAELLAAQYGVPQMRWRMFFVAWRSDLGISNAGFPMPTHGTLGIGALVPNRTVTARQSAGFLTVFNAIGDLPPVENGAEEQCYSGVPQTTYQQAMRRDAGSVLENHYAPRLSPQNRQRICFLKPGQDWRNLPLDLLPGSMKRALRKDHTRRFRRMSWEGIPRSIITRFRDPKSGEYTHPTQNRTITIREAARIQSFPDWFVFQGSHTEQYEQVGNAVPPLLARAVAIAVREAISSTAASVPVRSRYRIPPKTGTQLLLAFADQHQARTDSMDGGEFSESTHDCLVAPLAPTAPRNQR